MLCRFYLTRHSFDCQGIETLERQVFFMLEFTSGFTAIPNGFLDQIAPTLTAAELRIALYIYRHTIGYQKLSDTISYSQFTDGITTSDGRRLDAGAGVSRRSLPAALAGLERRGVISRSSAGGVVRYTVVQPASPAPAPAPAQKAETVTQDLPASQNDEDKPALQEPAIPPEPKQTLTAPVSPAVLPPAGQKLPASQPAPGQISTQPAPQLGQILPPTKQTDSKIKPDRAAVVNFIIQEIAGITPNQAEKLVKIAEQNQRDISYIKRLVGYVASVAGNPAAMLTTLIKTNQDRTTGPSQPTQEAGATRYINRQTGNSNSALIHRQPPIDFSKPFYQHLIAQQNTLAASASHSEDIE